MIKRLISAVRTKPSLRDWIELAVVAVVFGAIFVPLGLFTGLLYWLPLPGSLALNAVVMSLFLPAIGEELVFRGILPGRGETSKPRTWIAASVVLFTLWHVAEAFLMPNTAHIFLRADFLAQAAVLGLACAILRHRSGSLWPPVILHWIVAAGWLTLLGGPALSELR